MTRCKAFYRKMMALRGDRNAAMVFCEKDSTMVRQIYSHMDFMEEHFPNWLDEDENSAIALLNEGVTRSIRSLKKTNPELVECVLEEIDELKEWSSAAVKEIIARRLMNERPTELPLQLRLFNTWNFSEAVHGKSGYEWGYNTGHIIENLLYYYTERGDLVIDPMVGSGTTLDACRRMERKCKAYDLNPSRDEGIEENDLWHGIPSDEKAQLVFLDPPFYTLLHNEYRDYSHFLAFVRNAIQGAYDVLDKHAYLALIMMNLTEKEHIPKVCMIGDCYELLKKQEGLTFENMILSPLSTERAGIDKSERALLNNTRVVWVFRRNG